MEERRDEQTGLDLDAADVIVFAGPRANLRELDGVSGRRLPSGPAAAPRQIGLYGRPVAPRVLIGVGLDGTPEELAGFVKAAVIRRRLGPSRRTMGGDRRVSIGRSGGDLV